MGDITINSSRASTGLINASAAEGGGVFGVTGEEEDNGELTFVEGVVGCGLGRVGDSEEVSI